MASMAGQESKIPPKVFKALLLVGHAFATQSQTCEEIYSLTVTKETK